MFDFIEPDLYTPVHYNVLLILVIFLFICSRVYKINDHNNVQILNILGWIYLPILMLYIGFRPISGRLFGDTLTYSRHYSKFQDNIDTIIEKDVVFNQFMKWCSQFMDVQGFFILCACLYLIPILFFSIKYFKSFWFLGVILVVTSFSFWGYGTNGLRNGLGTHFFILGLCFYDKKVIMYLLFILGYLMHASMIIPIAAFVTSGLYKHPKYYIYIWLISIPLALTGGNVWANLFASLGFEEDRAQGYLVGGDEYMNQFSQTGFRWDFLLYSSTAVFAGWYFIYKKNITDVFYIHLFGTYCIANAFWILVITAAFSNRFAYLSWFLLPILVSYPILKYRIWKDQYYPIALILLCFFIFTYYMSMIK